MAPFLGKLWSGVPAVASWSNRLQLTQAACIAMLAAIFFAPTDGPARSIFVALVLPLAGLGLVLNWSRLRGSSVLVACALYLALMVLASAIGMDQIDRKIWVLSYQSVFVFLFAWTIGGLVATDDRFTDKLFLFGGLVAAASAAINIYFFFRDIVPDDLPFYYRRLSTTVGMPAYKNSTNISSTYAVFFVGTLAVAMRGRLPLPVRGVLAAAAALLLAGLLLTQARGGYVAAMVGLIVLALTASRPFARWLTACAVLAAVVVGFSVPWLREIIIARGLSARPEVWRGFLNLIIERPWIGYGVFDPIGILATNSSFLDQAHNLVLSAWFRAGLGAAISMAFILVGGLFFAWRYWLATQQVVPLTVMATIVTAGMVDYQLMISGPTWPWVTFWLPFGLCVGAEMAARRRDEGAGQKAQTT
jgi:O-antigen ligase